jgi:hypothetical protein
MEQSGYAKTDFEIKIIYLKIIKKKIFKLRFIFSILFFENSMNIENLKLEMDE